MEMIKEKLKLVTYWFNYGDNVPMVNAQWAYQLEVTRIGFFSLCSCEKLGKSAIWKFFSFSFKKGQIKGFKRHSIHSEMSSSAPVANKKSIGLPLLTWDNPVETGKVFGAVIFALVVLKSVNLLSLFFRLGFYALLTSAAAEYAGKLVTGTGFVTRVRPAYSDTFSKYTSKFLEQLSKDLPCLEQEGQRLLYSFNVENTLKTAGLFYVLYKITSWISLYNLILISTIAAFTLPAVYEKYQDEINAALKQAYKVASQKSAEYTKLASEKAAPYIKQADEKLGPVSKFIKSKYQVRTASTTVGETSPEAFVQPTTGSTSGSQATESNVKSTKNPFDKPIDTTYEQTEPIVTNVAPTSADVNTNAFPSVPETTPQSFVDQVKEVASEQVDVDDLKNDLLKNKAATPNF